MAMYFPDLESVKKLAELMARNEPGKEYRGVIPTTEEELPEARRQLAKYFRKVWQDEVQAMEIELAVTEENYKEKMSQGVMMRMVGGGRYDSNGDRL